MPEGVNQALKTLATTPATAAADSAPGSTPVATGEAKSSSSSGAIAEQARSQPPAEPTVDASSHTASNASAASGAVDGQALKIAARAPEANVTAPGAAQDEQVERTDCPTCGGYHSSSSGGVFHASIGCADGSCIPGRQPCSPSDKDSDTVVGAFLANLYRELCCPDPCYQPKWEPAANASFFADYARPRTVTRFRYDNLENMVRPDRNQFWIQQVTPSRKNGFPITNPQLRLQEVYLYQEAAGERGSLFVEIPYRQINPNYMQSQAGFSDINFGTKAMFYDTELLQMTFQFRTYTPVG